MGHVPPRSLPQARQGAHLPRRQRRRGGTPRSRAAQRRLVGRAGEAIAARHLQRNGCVVLAANLRVGRAEIDLIVRDGREPVVVEVKAGPSAELHFAADKEATLRAAMAQLDPPVRRLDLVTVQTRRSGVLVRWYKRV